VSPGDGVSGGAARRAASGRAANGGVELIVTGNLFCERPAFNESVDRNRHLIYLKIKCNLFLGRGATFDLSPAL
jgi:hypothetical protein